MNTMLLKAKHSNLECEKTVSVKFSMHAFDAILIYAVDKNDLQIKEIPLLVITRCDYEDIIRNSFVNDEIDEFKFAQQAFKLLNLEITE